MPNVFLYFLIIFFISFVHSTSAENIESEINNSTSNGLENFQIDDEDTPELFNSDNSEHSEVTFSSAETSENNKDEDDLEIPAFLRRQKN